MVPPDLDHDPLVADEHTVSAIWKLQYLLSSADAQPFRLVPAAGQALEVPTPVERALRVVVEALAAGDAVNVIPMPEQLTTTQAARLLEISRPTLIGLPARCEIPYRLIGTHR
ncbi:MAG: hypothetical protein ACRDG4_06950, partial [Chloroflexota bacterium]